MAPASRRGSVIVEAAKEPSASTEMSGCTVAAPPNVMALAAMLEEAVKPLPEIAVVSPDTLLVLAFGAILGLKIGILFYTLVGYEGTRALLRHLFRREVAEGGPGAERLLLWMSVLPVLLIGLTAHFVEGHCSHVSFYLFPWVLLLSLTWPNGAGRSLALGAVVGVLLLLNLHYTTIMTLTIAGLAGVVVLVRHVRQARTFALAGVVVLAALGLSMTRVALTWEWVRHFPRDPLFEDVTIPLDVGEGLLTLVRPFGPRAPLEPVMEKPFPLPRTEVVCYVGLLAVVLAFLGLRWRGRWRVRWWQVLVPILFLMAWNNRDGFSPSTWLRAVPPWSFMVFCTKWRLYAAFLLLAGAVGGLLAVHDAGRRRVAWVLGALIVLDLGAQTVYRWHGQMRRTPPPIVRNPDPPVSVATRFSGHWPALRRNDSNAPSARHHSTDP